VLHCLVQAVDRDLLGVRCAWTLAITGATWLFAVASAASLFAAVRWSARADRPGLSLRLVPSLAAMAAVALASWAGMHGIIGLRTWAW
jgi:hypothetical protein